MVDSKYVQIYVSFGTPQIMCVYIYIFSFITYFGMNSVYLGHQSLCSAYFGYFTLNPEPQPLDPTSICRPSILPFWDPTWHCQPSLPCARHCHNWGLGSRSYGGSW